MKSLERVCIVPQVSGVGGMVSFVARFTDGLRARGVEVCQGLRCDAGGPGEPPEACDALLVVGGTRELRGLARLRKYGVRIVQRLDGINWLHRRCFTGIRHFIRAEYGNFLLNFIRTRLADHIVYQSEFSRRWWERVYGKTPVESSVVYNAVDLRAFSPNGLHLRSAERARILLIEGNLGGGYEIGLQTAVRLTQTLQNEHRMSVELMVVGRVSAALQAETTRTAGVPLLWAGLLVAQAIPAACHSAHLLYAADIHPACPNSVIEALACGLPVVAFDTGALSELITGDSGRIVPYGGDAWRLQPPDVPALARAAIEILRENPRFRVAARSRAEAAFGLDTMLDGYLQALTG